MRNKGAIIFLTVVVTALCLYYLSFTFVSRGVQQKATAYATDELGNIDYMLKQRYLDSVWNEPVYNFLGINYTYKDVKETELSFGLDLQGGMHVTLEVSPVEILKGLSGNSKDEDFLAAIEDTRKSGRRSQESFIDIFYDKYKERKPDGRLSEVFATAANRGRINLDTPDDEILKIIKSEVEDAIDRSFNILRTRIDRFGTSNPNIQKLQGSGRIQVELPGVDNPDRVKKLLQGVAKLEFWEVYELDQIAETITTINDFLVEQGEGELPELGEGEEVDVDPLAGLSDDETQISSLEDLDSAALEDLDENELAELLEGGADSADLEGRMRQQASPLFTLLKAQYGLIYDVKDTMQINQILQRKEVKALIPPTMKFLWSVKPQKLDNSDAQLLELYAIRTNRDNKAPLTGEVVTDARQDFDQGSRPAVSMQMNTNGAKKWRRVTADNINKRIAIVLDDYVYSAPTVQNEISGGNSSITGNFTIEEAKDLANVLKAGTLPAPTTIVEDAIVGPTLGQVSRRQGFTSMVAGMIVVVLFMIGYYNRGGLIANLALLFNIFFILGILAQLGSSLTLPGIAGIVLTIGMAIDANVLIFERIREELANGAKIKAAISDGYSKAYSSIVDANATTFLTGVILYTLGQGPVKGFAITLMIGIVCSFFSAVFITRVFVDWMARKGEKSKISFDTPLSKNFLKDVNFDFIGKRKIAYIFSSAFIAVGILAMVIQGGLKFGVDFTGGRSYVVTFYEPVEPSQLSIALGETLEQASTEVKTFGGNNILKITTSYMIEDESSEADSTVRASLISGLEEHTGFTSISNDVEMGEAQFTISSSSKVSGTIADDIKNASQQAVVFALIVIFLYILVRFRKWQFGLGAIVALFHDSLFVLSAFAIVGLLGVQYEVDQVFIAAMLTIIGYSINDTVVVFDRIRETLGIKPNSDLTKTFNESINNTISRTVITSATTLIVVLILFIFGGAALSGFAFALIVGILVGTYSSVFVASPIVLELYNKKKEAKKAKA